MTDQAVWEMQWPVLENLVDGSNSCFRMERDFWQSRVGREGHPWCDDSRRTFRLFHV
jgi:hypothetical protein